ncbi:MAG: alpha amylase C-terminal domain-containing protein, partial [Oscillospiraceae bacterium]|nr:alpha amylase C-terminal domain-containing protein [Oscillospiraceae bacterium]
SKIFNYGKPEVVHFLLSNIKFWLDEYHFDGFRFDGVTSMIYNNNGLGISFDNYSKYFGKETNQEALTYLQLATDLINEVKPSAITIAEDMSGMPGMCLPVSYGGIGFDYRLSMGVPDFWIKTLKEVPDEKWDLWKMWYELTTRRPMEKNIAYCESHDQALVGDKTIIFWLADKEMYFHMNKDDNNIIIDRAIALHKMIRFVTLTLGGEGYLNFMGNEFGHPEWIDFPRVGNNLSYKYAKRQWHLVNDCNLKFQYLYNFDKAMINFTKKYSILSSKEVRNIYIDQEKLILAYKKGNLLFLFNFHPSLSEPDYLVRIYERGYYEVIFSSDDANFGGFNRISKDYVYMSDDIGFKIYIPCRTAIVLKKLDQ